MTDQQHPPTRCSVCGKELAFLQYATKPGKDGRTAKWPVYEKCDKTLHREVSRSTAQKPKHQPQAQPVKAIPTAPVPGKAVSEGSVGTSWAKENREAGRMLQLKDYSWSEVETVVEQAVKAGTPVSAMHMAGADLYSMPVKPAHLPPLIENRFLTVGVRYVLLVF